MSETPLCCHFKPTGGRRRAHRSTTNQQSAGYLGPTGFCLFAKANTGCESHIKQSKWGGLSVLWQQPVEVILPLLQHLPKILLKKHQREIFRYSESIMKPGEERHQADASADNQLFHSQLTDQGINNNPKRKGKSIFSMTIWVFST